MVETWKSDDGKMWCRRWSDGWIEQGGQTTGTVTSITFPTPFTTLNYTVTFGFMGTDASNYSPYTYQLGINALSITSKTSIPVSASNNAKLGPKHWYACGY